MSERAVDIMRQMMAAVINSSPRTRDELAQTYGTNNVWTLHELSKEFELHSFSAPYCVVIRKSDHTVGSVLFQHEPRMYFGFEAYDGHDLRTMGSATQRGESI